MSNGRGIAELQESDGFIHLHKAISVAHRHTSKAHLTALTASLLVATLSIWARIVPSARPTVVIVGALWAAVYVIVVAPWSRRYLRVSATLQELFEIRLFGLPWNTVAVGSPMPDEEINRLARRFRGQEKWLRDYYLVADVPEPYDVLFCLEQNLAWGARVRRKYAQLLGGFAIIWSLAGIATGIFANFTVAQLATDWFVPSLGLLLFCLDVYQAQIAITRERLRVVGLLRERAKDFVANPVLPGPEWTSLARQIQDVLFQLRRTQPRVPLWFFRRDHDADKADFELRKKDLEARVREVSPSPDNPWTSTK